MNDPDKMNFDGRFISTLMCAGKGAAVKKLNDAQEKLVHLVKLTGKSGEITVKILYKTAPYGENAFHTEWKHSVKLPDIKNPPDIMFATDDNRLVRQDPRQIEMPFREEEATAPTNLRTIEINPAASTPAREAVNA